MWSHVKQKLPNLSIPPENELFLFVELTEMQPNCCGDVANVLALCLCVCMSMILDFEYVWKFNRKLSDSLLKNNFHLDH